MADSANVYFTLQSPYGMTVGALLQQSLAGGTPVTLGSEVSPGGIAVDATSVYFATPSGVFKVTPK